MKTIYLPFIFSLVIIFQLQAQTEVKFERFTKEHGLSSNYVRSIVQDKYGFLWFGTNGGLSRFDGITLKTYTDDENDSTSIVNGWVLSLFKDSHEDIYIAIYSDLLKHDYENDNFIHINANMIGEDSLWKKIIVRDIEEVDGEIWTTSYIYNPATHRASSLPLPDSVDRNLCTQVLKDSKGDVWFGTNRFGIYMYDTKTKKCINYLHNPNDNTSLGNNSIECIYEDSKGRIWIGTEKKGLDLFIPAGKNTNNTFKHFAHHPKNDNSLSNNKVHSITEDRYNQLWVSTLNGLCRLDEATGGFQRFYYDESNPESINDNTIRVSYKDEMGNMWFGTRLGVAKFKRQRFYSYSHSAMRNSISHNKVQCLCSDQKMNIYVGTPVGIDYFDRKKNQFSFFEGQKKQNSWLTSGVLCMLMDKESNLWVGTWRSGLHCYNIYTGEHKNYTTKGDSKKTLSSNNIFSICESSSNRIWIGTWGGGVNYYDKNTGNIVQIDSKLGNNNNVTQIFEDSKMNIWISTFEGLFVIKNAKTDKPKISRYLDHNSGTKLDSLNITGVFESSDGYIWLCSYEGIFRITPETDEIMLFTIQDGLPTNAIASINEDVNKNLWIGTSTGLVKYIPPLDNSKEKGVFSLFYKETGLQTEFQERSTYKFKDGTLAFGGNIGFNIFHPDSISDDTIPPKITFTQLKISNKPVNIGDTINQQVILNKSILTTGEIILNHKNNSFGIEFAALHYVQAKNNKYLYKLDGFENEWQVASSQNRQAVYTNINEGEYVFRLKASNCDNMWSKKELALHITILPPWWRTWWFRISITILIIGSAISFYLWRISALKQQKKLLEKKVFERTAELREANSQLEEKQEEIMQQNEEIITVNNQLKSKNEEIESSKQKLEKAFNNITLLSEFGQKLTATFDFDAINKMIYEYVNSLMDTAAFGIGIFNEKRKVIDFPYFMENGKPVPYFYKDLLSEKSLSVRCFKNSEEIFINNLSVDYKEYLGELPDVQTSKLPSSVIHLPLTIENKPIGTLTVNSFKKNAYNENDIANLRTLASYISIALDNSKAYRIIRSKNEQISGSIRYGQTIQQAMLPSKKQLDAAFENFILFRPKDLVSGDFYWFTSINNGNVETRHALSLLAVVDCTGHGVPGAFMSMIGSRLLNDIVIERKIFSPARILDQLDKMIKKALRQDTTDNHDGMDLCLCRFQNNGKDWEMTFAGAKRSLIIFDSTSNSIEEIHGTRRSIGGFMRRSNSIEFTENTRTVHADDVFYLSTDGLVDQCNPQKHKFSQKKLIELLSKIHTKNLSEQKKDIENTLDDFQGGFEQRDDITLVGVKLK